MTKDTQTVSSVEVAKMIGKQHYNLLKDIRRYTKKINEDEGTHGEHAGDFPSIEISQDDDPLGLKIRPDDHGEKPVSSDFWIESTYKDVEGRKHPCYLVTRKGCEFIANKLTGKKGIQFTADYVNMFHTMMDEIKSCKVFSEEDMHNNLDFLNYYIDRTIRPFGMDRNKLLHQLYRCIDSQNQKSLADYKAEYESRLGTTLSPLKIICLNQELFSEARDALNIMYRLLSSENAFTTLLSNRTQIE